MASRARNWSINVLQWPKVANPTYNMGTCTVPKLSKTVNNLILGLHIGLLNEQLDSNLQYNMMSSKSSLRISTVKKNADN